MLLKYTEITPEHLDIIGGKAKSLYLLSRIGVNVPEWYVITSDTFESFFQENALRFEKIIKENPDIASDKLKKLIKHNKTVQKTIRNIIKDLPDIFPVSVRSSAINEDTSAYSFAGQYSTFLNVKDNIERYILDCLCSMFNKGIIVYHRMKGIDILKNRIAIIIQRMINAASSGVVFTKDPVSKKNRIIINASFGLGEGVVADKVKSDVYIYTRKGKKIEETIEQKDGRVVSASDGGTQIWNLKKDEINKPVLTPHQIKQLINTALKIENNFKTPQDIEFAFEGNELFILQARPITTISARENFLTWDNSNIVESFSGPTTPLTFSFANEAYSTIYRIVMENLGVKKDVLEKNAMIFTNMIGYVNKRVYYSLDSWFKALSFLPAYQYNKGFMEEMMGVKEAFDIDKSKTSIRGILEIGRVIFRLLFAYLNHERNIKKFMGLYEDTMKNFYKRIKEVKHPTDYVELYQEMKRKLLYNWVVPINNDIFTMIFYGSLQKFIFSVIGSKDKRIQNDLLTGEGDIASTQVTELLWKIALLIKRNKTAMENIKKLDEKAFLQSIYTQRETEEIKEKFSLFIEKFGNRSINELKLEVENIKDRPEKLIPLLKQYVLNENFSYQEILSKEKVIREQATKHILEIINKERFPKRFFSKIMFNFLLRNTRRFVKNRENLRFCRTNVFGAVKEMFRGIAKEFVSAGVIEKEEDIFYLTVQEIFSYIYGTSVTYDLKGIIKIRKKEQDELKDKELPERFKTRFIPYTELDKFEVKEKYGLLNGLGCSPGVVRGRVQIVENPYSAYINGDIMVAEKTDPGWLPIFPLFKALIIERGSMLSHSAIVARELGIPAVVGVRGATKVLKNGYTVEIDGSTGEVSIIKKGKNEG